MEKNQRRSENMLLKKVGFLAIEYSGHGKSNGEFNKGNITMWSKDETKLSKKIIKK